MSINGRPETWDKIVIALHRCIDTHGPITHKFVPSAAYRILAIVLLEEVIKEEPATAYFIVKMLRYKFPKRIRKCFNFLDKLHESKVNKAIADSIKYRDRNAALSQAIRVYEGGGKVFQATEAAQNLYVSRLKKKTEKFHNLHQELQREIYRLKNELYIVKEMIAGLQRWDDDGGN